MIAGEENRREAALSAGAAEKGLFMFNKRENEGKYYNEKKGALVDLGNECCDFETWNKNTADEYFCCRHPHGFYVFISPKEIRVSDEYQGGDPYRVAKNITGAFQQRRLNCTIQLIRNVKADRSLRLLDVGCGQGHITDRIKKEFPNYDIHGLDHSISAIDYANSNFGDIDFIVANAYHPPFANEYFDIILFNNIWEHVPDPLNLLNSVSRILKPFGFLIISTPSRYRFINLFRVCLGRNVKFVSKAHVTEYTVGQIKEQLRYGGYKVSEVLSPSIKTRSIVIRFVKSFVFLFIKLINSHHVLETTAFYSAIKLPPASPIATRGGKESS
jgi:2-polyprenyl-3-methyl-5-hydroxy-6-metoxy-1,4-benzoquinol methylase